MVQEHAWVVSNAKHIVVALGIIVEIFVDFCFSERYNMSSLVGDHALRDQSVKESTLMINLYNVFFYFFFNFVIN